MTASASIVPTPVGVGERVAELDVLRGVALFGVFLMNIVGFGRAMSTGQQLLSLPNAPFDLTLAQILEWLVADKANTLFAFLFGLGFYLQMQRLEARGVDFERIYLRRLTFLLVLGIIHVVFLWTWDILHLYALAGFALFAMRGASNRTLLVGGVLLALFGRTAHDALLEFTGVTGWHGWPDPYADEVLLARQEVMLHGDFLSLVRAFAEYTWVDYILEGFLIGWFLYVLGRFMAGAWVGRQDWLQNASAHLGGFRRVLRIALPAGLIAAGLAQIIEIYDRGGRLPPWDHWEFLASSLHLLSTPVLATGYLCAIVVGLHTSLGQKLLAPFAYAGRMALTNYVSQSFVYALVFFGFGPGLGLIAHIGSGALTAIVIVVYAVQVVASRWWLRRFRFGPLEWLWRAYTYGRLPVLRIAPAPSP
ncbi:MAG TPA: DUF418 domain-containing protein [Steroidobacteraceae bacterium]|nr:DUF418 domain-containing protein [Steroidobacteraceae bacterium]